MSTQKDNEGIKRIHATLKEFRNAAGQLVVDSRYTNMEKIAMINGLKLSSDNLGVMICSMGGDPWETNVAARCSGFLLDCIANLKMEGEEDDEDH